MVLPKTGQMWVHVSGIEAYLNWLSKEKIEILENMLKITCMQVENILDLFLYDWTTYLIS